MSWCFQAIDLLTKTRAKIPTTQLFHWMSQSAELTHLLETIRRLCEDRMESWTVQAESCRCRTNGPFGLEEPIRLLVRGRTSYKTSARSLRPKLRTTLHAIQVGSARATHPNPYLDLPQRHLLHDVDSLEMLIRTLYAHGSRRTIFSTIAERRRRLNRDIPASCQQNASLETHIHSRNNNKSWRKSKGLNQAP